MSWGLASASGGQPCSRRVALVTGPMEIALTPANGKAMPAARATSARCVTLEELVNASSLILRGKVVSLATRLSKDERIVVTEYEIAPQTFYKGSFAVQSRPGFVPGLIVQRPGGAMNFNGLKLATDLEGFPEDEAPKVGEELILFLTRSEVEPGKFRMIGNAAGAFRIVDGKVAALTASAARSRGDSPRALQEFERDLRRLLAR